MQAIQVNGYPEAKAALVERQVPELKSGFVAIKTHYSALNHQDMLAISGKAKVMRHFPLIAGMDAAGEVIASEGRFTQGDAVFCVGAGLGEKTDGGLAETVLLPEAAVIALPNAWSTKTVMLLGSAGFAAAMAILQLQQSGILPEQGELLITGASGAVGLWAVKIASYLGYDVVAVTRNPALQEDILLRNGALRLVSLSQFQASVRPLNKGRFAGGIDCLGGQALAAMLSQIQAQGAVAAIGMTQSPMFSASVMPFILRGISLFGIASAHCPPVRREQVWQWLARHFDEDFIATMPYQEIFLDEVLLTVQRWQMQRAGRVIVRCQR